MARRRLQQKGDLYKQGGWWKLRWREDQRKADGSIQYAWSRPVWIGPAEGRGKLSEKQAQRISWDQFLSHLDQNMRTPQSIMTVEEFVERRFIPEHVALKKTAGRVHYGSMLPHVLNGIPEKRMSFKGTKRGESLPEVRRRFGIGQMRLRDVSLEDVQRLVSEAIQRGYSVQTAKHIRTCVSAIFTHAEKKNWFSGRNPAHFVELPEMTRKTPHALSFEELKGLLFALKPLARAMVLCASLTSMNIAEVLGLRWGRVNLTAEPIISEGESIPGYHLAVREQWYRRQFGSVKKAARRRNLPIPTILAEALAEMKPETPAAGDIVFVGRAGRPVDAGAILKRQIRKHSPNLGWHDLRRTFATLADQIGMTMGERQALMGHARASMTMQYTHTPGEHAIAALEEMGDRVKGPVN